MYEKQTWKTGDVITEEKLNHMEDGIFNSGALVLVADENATLNHTWEEIKNAIMSGRNVGMVVTTEGSNETSTHFEIVYSADTRNDGAIEYCVELDGKTYATNSPTGYPRYESN